MDVTGRSKGAGQDRPVKNASRAASPTLQPAALQRDEAAVETQVNMVSPFAHPRGGRESKNARFDLRQFLAKHPVPAALWGLTLVGGTIAAVVVKRRRRDAWGARLNRLRRALLDAANGVG